MNSTGAVANATGADAIAIGETSLASGDNSVALGSNARSSAANSVAIGANSVAAQANTVSVGTVGGERRIVNVLAGVAATDAVNVGQLANETSARIAGDAALQGQLDDLSFDLKDDRRDARAGTSAALAAAGLPQAMDAGRTMIAGGVGTYRGRTALAVGASHRLSSGNAVVKLGVTYDSSEHVGGNAGVGFEF